MSERQHPNHIGRYEISRVLGEGAAGIVYRAYDPVMDRTVAIKSAKAEVLSDEDLNRVIEEFRHEARIAGKHAHENIVGIFDVVEHDGLEHIVMEHVAGRSVTEYLKSMGPLPIEIALMIAYKCAVGLAYIHFHGIIHRDIKPGNILYHHAGNLVKIMDFSISQEIDQDMPKGIGTAAYMAPEHFDPAVSISQSTDIFALGSTMYRMLVKKYPFKVRDAIEQIQFTQQTPVIELRPEIPAAVNEIVERAMAKKVTDRFQSAPEFAYAIRDVMEACFPGTLEASTAETYLALH